MVSMSDVTQLLAAIDQGDAQASSELLPLVYNELRKLAAQRLAQEKPGQTEVAPKFRTLQVLKFRRYIDAQRSVRWRGSRVSGMAVHDAGTVRS